MPVVRNHNGAGGLFVGEALGYIRCGEYQEKGNQAAGHVHAVEACGEVKDRTVGIAGDGEAFVNQLGVFGDLTSDKDGAHKEGDDEPPAQAADISAFSGKNSQLAGHGTEHQNGGVHAGKGDIQQCCFFSP